MSLYNDGYSNRAMVLGMALPNQQPTVTFTQNGTNNLLNTDTIEVGNQTLEIVTALGSTPGTVLKGANWLATMTNVIAAMAASIAGSGATTTYIPSATASNVYGEVAGNVAQFYAITPGAPATPYNAVYTDTGGTSGGTFSAATLQPVSAALSQTRAIDWTQGMGLSIQFEVMEPILNGATFEVWGDIANPSNPCQASGVAGNQAQMMDADLCNPITGTLYPMTVYIPPTQTVTATNIQGFLQTSEISPVGGVYQGRPRCLAPGNFVFVKAISGDTDNVNISALVSRLKYTS